MTELWLIYKRYLSRAKWAHLVVPCGHTFWVRELKIDKIIAHSCGFATVLLDFDNPFKL
jgi:hypothetical protein